MRRFFDWIELENLLSVPVDLGGFHLTDQSDEPMRWQFPTPTIIAPGDYLVVFASRLNVLDPTLDEAGKLHTNFALDSVGEYVGLTDYTGGVVDAIAPQLPPQRGNISYGRDGDARQYFPVPSPGAANEGGLPGFVSDLSFSQAHGFFDAPFQLEITKSDPDALLRYTLDGSTPTESNGLDYVGPIEVASTTMVRAAAFKSPLIPSRVETQTYFFLSDILTQSPDGSPPPGWPRGPVRGQALDYGMDPEIVNDPQWGSEMIAALTQIPSLSLVTDQANLTDPNQGIYVNASQDGRGSERPTSLELINPDGTPGFQIDAGLRIRGGFSRGGFNPKHSFRVFFRDVYEGQLDFPLFEEEGVDSFKAVDLRTAQNYAWSNDTFNDQTRNSFLRDIFSRDLQREQGQAYTRGRYYHLYLNGQYWGLFQTEERPEASYAEAYFGGLEENYDVIKASGGTLEATDGTLEPWTELWRLANAGFDSLDDYFFIQGRNPDGTENPELEVQIRMEVLIDFMLNVIFTGNEDMPTTLGAGDRPNNFYSIRDPNTREGWILIAHDNEHNMLNVRYDQTRDDTAGRSATTFNPKYLHQQLDEFPEYQIQFADRVQELFFHDGPLVAENAQALMQERASQIDQAIVAESARWGDQHNNPPLTKNTWSTEVDWLLNTFLAQRGEIVLDQLRRKGLYPELAAVELNQHGGLVDSGFQLGMNAPAGTILFSLDGTDPRAVGGAINPAAREWDPVDPPVLRQDSVVKARVWDGTQWSALTQAEFSVGTATAPTALRIAEIHYNPAPPSTAEIAAGFDDKDDFEFIELINTSDAPLDLSTAHLVQVVSQGETVGVSFDFANAPIQRLAAGQRVLIVEDAAAFRFRYGDDLPVAGQWSGGLGNGGERLTVVVGDQPLQQFAYDDAWFPITDGGGPSLEMLDPYQIDLDRWGSAESWRPSEIAGGTPGRGRVVIGDANGDGYFDSADLVTVFQAGEYEDEIAANSTFAEGDWDGDGDFTTADLVLAFQSGSYVTNATGKSVRGRG